MSENDDLKHPGAMQRFVDRAMAEPDTRHAFEAEQARLAGDPAARYDAAGLVPPEVPGGLPTRDPQLDQALGLESDAPGAGQELVRRLVEDTVDEYVQLVRRLVEDTVDEYVQLVRAESDHPLFARLASPSDEDRDAMGRLVYTLAMLAGIYVKAPTIDVHSLHRDVRRLVRGRPWLRSMAYDYLHQMVEDPAVSLSLKALVDA